MIALDQNTTLRYLRLLWPFEIAKLLPLLWHNRAPIMSKCSYYVITFFITLSLSLTAIIKMVKKLSKFGAVWSALGVHEPVAAASEDKNTLLRTSSFDC